MKPALALFLLWMIVAPCFAQPHDPYKLAEAGFTAYETGDYEDAVQKFKAALAIKPDLELVWAQLGYAYRKLNRNDEAANAFRQALRHDIKENRFGYRREVQILTNRFDATAYVVYRSNALSNRFLSVTGPSIAQSQGGVELAWTPPNIGFRDGRLLQVFGRLNWSHDGDSFAFRDETVQGGAGVRYRPLKTQNLIFSAERLMAVGAAARNDWMLRASYSTDIGYDLHPDELSWNYATLYLDGAVIDPADPDILLTAEGRYGRSFFISGNGYGPAFVLTPYLLAQANWQKDDFHTTTLIEAGPGISAKLFFADTAESAHAGAVELLLQYRVKIAGDSLGGSGFVATLVYQY